jgi:hypothetical protein
MMPMMSRPAPAILSARSAPTPADGSVDYGDWMGEALVEQAKHDIDRGDRGDDQVELVR